MGGYDLFATSRVMAFQHHSHFHIYDDSDCDNDNDSDNSDCDNDNNSDNSEGEKWLDMISLPPRGRHRGSNDILGSPGIAVLTFPSP